MEILKVNLDQTCQRCFSSGHHALFLDASLSVGKPGNLVMRKNDTGHFFLYFFFFLHVATPSICDCRVVDSTARLNWMQTSCWRTREVCFWPRVVDGGLCRNKT